jgi:hypothetical protein
MHNAAYTPPPPPHPTHGGSDPSSKEDVTYRRQFNNKWIWFLCAFPSFEKQLCSQHDKNYIFLLI